MPLDRDLAGALNQVKRRAMNFALVVKGPDEGTLIVSSKTIPTQKIDEAVKELGGGKRYKSRCSGDAKGQLVFETAKEPLPSAKTLKAVIRRDAGLSLNVEVRTAADLTDDDDKDGADPSAAKAAKDREAVLKRLKALAPHVTRVLT